MDIKTTSTCSVTIGLFLCENSHRTLKEVRTEDVENEYEVPTGASNEDGSPIVELRKSVTTKTLNESCDECGKTAECKDSKFVEFSF